MKVTVLGAGPSGLFASLAVLNAGYSLTVCERNPRKPDASNAGVYFLHDDCDLPLRHRDVDIIPLGGNWQDYGAKVYTNRTQQVSFPSNRHTERAYDGMQALAMAWDIVHPFVKQGEVSSSWLENNEVDYIVNTVPLNILYPERLWRSKAASIYRGIAPEDESYMLYHANSNIRWYRASALFGVFTMEYVREMEGYQKVRKVINSPNSMPKPKPNILLTGRFGAWDKRKLSHHAYYDTLKWLGKIP